MDQLNVEKLGIPTVTIVTTAFEESFRNLMKENGISTMSLVASEHPIAGHNLEGIRKKVEKDFPSVVKAAIQWQPGR